MIKKKLTLTSATCTSASHALPVYSALNCVLSSRTPTPLLALCTPSTSPLAPPTPLGLWAAELCIFREGADKQNHSCKQSLFRQCAVSGKKVSLTCTTTAYTLPMTSILHRPKKKKKKKNPHTFCQQSADSSLVFQ